MRWALVVAALVVGGWPLAPADADPTPAPALWVDTTGLEFGPVDVWSTSPAQAVTLHNVGAETLTDLVVGAPGGGFDHTSTCDAALAPGASCSVSYSLSPSTTGAYAGSSAISSSDGSATVAMTATGVEPAFPLRVNPTGLDFGTVATPGTSTRQVVVTNTSAASLSFTFEDETTTGEFATDPSDCTGSPKTLAPGATCHVDVSMVSTSLGAHAGTEVFTLAVVGGEEDTFTIPLEGTGARGLILSPSRLMFGPVPVGTTSLPRSTTLTNATGAPIPYTSIDVPTVAGYDRTVTCPAGSTLAVGASCTLTYTSTPSASGSVNRNTTITLTPASGPVWTSTLELNTDGTTGLRVWPVSLNFGDIVSGATSGTRSITVTNVTASTISFDASTTVAAGPFALVGNDCAVSLAPSASCSLSFAFHPTSVASSSTNPSLSLDYTANDATTTAITYTLSGRGVADAASQFPIEITDRNLPFGNVQTATSVSRDVVVRNVSASAQTVSLTGGTPSGSPVAFTNLCGSSFTLAAGATCILRYTFTAAASSIGTLLAQPSLTVNAVARTFNISFTGTGTFPLTAIQRGVEYGLVWEKSATGCSGGGCPSQPTRDIEVVNTSPNPVSFTSSNIVTPNASLAVTANTCSGTPKVLAGGASCVITVQANPVAEGVGSATMNPSFNVGGTSRNVAAAFSWTGAFPFRVSHTGVDFGERTVGTSSQMAVTLDNLSPFTQVVASSAAPPPPSSDFSASLTCDPIGVPSGGSCALPLAYAPSAAGAIATDQTASLTIGTHTKSFTVRETGIGTGSLAASLVVTPNAIDLGPVAPGATATRTITARNVGTATISGLSLANAAGSGISLTGSCPSLAPRASCDLTAQMVGNGSGLEADLAAAMTFGAVSHPISIRGRHEATTAPSRPTDVSAVAGVDEATVSWTAPEDDGGVGISGYVVTTQVDGLDVDSDSFDGSATTRTITGLERGETYTFTVTAVNSAGSSAPSDPSDPVLIPDVPGAPTAVSATAGGHDDDAIVSWTAPTDDGGAVVTGYRVTPRIAGVEQAAQTFDASSTTRTLTGLQQGTTYTFTVRALNLVGAGPASAPSGEVTPSQPLQALWVDTTALEFDPVAVNTFSPTQTVVVRNVGTATISGLTIATPTSPFSRTTTCGTSLASGAACGVSYRIRPTAVGGSSTSAAISSSGGGAAVALSGYGHSSSGYPLRLTYPSIDFGTIRSPGTSTISFIEIGNQTSSSISFTLEDLATSGEFTAVATSAASCAGSPRTLAAGATCTISAAMKSVTAGSHTGAATFRTQIVGGTSMDFSVALSGIGAQGLVLSPNKLDFGLVPLGTTSPSADAVLTNTGTDSLPYSAIDTTPVAGYDRTISCPSSTSIAPGESCLVTYRFTPTVLGASTSTTAVAVTPGTGPVISLPLDLTGQGAAGLIVQRRTVSFGDVVAGTTSSADPIVITNATTSAIAFDAAASIVSGPFTVTGSTCSGALAAGAACAVSVVAAPTAAGTANGSLSLALDYTANPATTSTSTISLTATGVASGSQFPIQFDTGGINFGQVPMGSTAEHVALLRNTGTTSAIVGISGLGTSSQFVSTVNDCGASRNLAPGATCPIRFRYGPASTASLNAIGGLTLTVGAVSRPLTISSIVGSGVSSLVVRQAAVDFGTSYAWVRQNAPGGTGDPTPEQDITILNTAQVPVTFTPGTPTSTAGAVTVKTNECGTATTELWPNDACPIRLELNPQAEGASTGTLNVPINEGNINSTRSVPVKWTGAFPWRLSATSVDFGNVAVGSSLTRPMNSVKLVSGVGFSGFGPGGGVSGTGFSGTFSFDNSPFGFGASFGESITFTPSGTGTATGIVSFSVPVNGITKVLSASLTGNSAAPVADLVVSPGGVDLGPVAPADGQVTRSIRLYNAGTTTLSGLTISNASGQGLSLTGSCGTLFPSGTCTLTARFSSNGTRSRASLAPVLQVGSISRTLSLAAFHAADEVPGAPTGVTATFGDAQATVSWSPPVFDGGPTITGYVVTPYVDGVPQASRSFASTATTQVVTGLTNGTTYRFSVAAINAVGTGPESALSDGVTPGRAPDAPAAPTATAGNGRVELTWAAPESDGGRPISGYVVTPYVGGVAQAQRSFGSPATAQTIEGLANATAYTFTVAAVNSLGAGPESPASTAVTPRGIALTTTPSPWATGQTVTLRAQSTVGNTGTVTFFDGTTSLGTKTVTSGVATLLTAKLTVGDHPITARYLATPTSTPSVSDVVVHHVDKGTTGVTVSSTPSVTVSGETTKLRAVVAAVAPAVGTPAGSVTFANGSTVLGTVTMSGGAASLSVKLAVGDSPITATYNGNGAWEGSTSAAYVHHVDRAHTTAALTSTANPSVWGQSVTLKAKISVVAPGTGTPAGTVEFYDGTTLLATKTLSSGAASYAFKPTVGTHDFAVLYLGSSTHEGSGGALTQVVDRASTTTTLASQFPTTTLGHSGKVTATVKTLAPGVGTPAGDVQFWDDGTLLATVPLVSGKASILISSLARGEHHLVALYLGDANAAPSGSTSLTQTIT